jgi:hypothetical protein
LHFFFLPDDEDILQSVIFPKPIFDLEGLKVKCKLFLCVQRI